MEAGAMFTLKQVADAVAMGRLATTAKLLNAGGGVQLNENEPDPNAQVPREAVIDAAVMATGTPARRLYRLLGNTQE